MTEVPKIVHDRLRAAELARGVAGASHPDADLLTAFAEQALSPAERDSLLQHLAACGDCRELVALALPAEAVTPSAPAETESDRVPVKAKDEKNWLNAFAWPTLRWGALAAGVIVAGSLLLLHRGNAPVAAPANSQMAANTPSAAVPQILQPPAAAPTSPAQDQAPSELASTKHAKTGSTLAKLAANANSGILIPEAKTTGTKKDAFRADKLASVGAAAFDAPAPGSMSETVEVTTEAPLVSEAVPATAANLMARNEALKIEKAKPAPPESSAQPVALQAAGANKSLETNASSASLSTRSAALSNAYSVQKEDFKKQALTPTVKFAIADGILRRSTDGGVSWQDVVSAADHLLLCYAPHGQEIWTGGQAGTLFHSSDAGITWVEVRPSINGRPLSADITHIDFHGPAEVVVSTSNSETWTSADGGKTWATK